MLSSVALRAQVASILEALSRAAAAEIAELVEDGMVLLRLETCQRDQEIQKLRSHIRLLHSELRATRGPGTRRPEPRGGDGELELELEPRHTILPHAHTLQHYHTKLYTNCIT